MENTQIVRVDRAEKLRRVQFVVSAIVAGVSEDDLAKIIAAKYPAADFKPLLAGAMAVFEGMGEPDQNTVRGFAIEGTRSIYRKCIEAKEYANALRALRQLVDLSAG